VEDRVDFEFTLRKNDRIVRPLESSRLITDGALSGNSDAPRYKRRSTVRMVECFRLYQL